MCDSYLGEIRIFAGNYAPKDWRICNGLVLNISEYQTLFALIGTKFGGDGRTTFALPDLRGRLPIGQGAGTALTPRTLGQTGGSDNVTPGVTQLPSHSHQLNASAVAATTNIPGPTVFLAATPAKPGDKLYILPGQTGTTSGTISDKTITNSGGSQPHNNLMPCMGLNFIISMKGLFPTRQA
jgi:microcystin-dependent protein